MNLTHTLIAVAALALVGCSSESGPTSSGANPPAGRATTGAQQTRVEKAATIARAVQTNPDNADQILRDHGMTEQQFEDLLYEIAADPAMSAEYNARVRP